MNILLINHYAGSPKYGMEYRPYYLAREWVKMGHSVSIVASSVSHVRTISPKINGHVTQEMVDGIRYLWLKTPSYNGNGIPRAINIFSFVGRLLLNRNAIARIVKPDLVIASSTYPLDIIAARVLAQKGHAKLLFEVHDLWPLSPIELGGMSKDHPFIILMQWAENYAYRNADLVVSLLPKAKEYMLQHGMKPEKFIHIPNGIDLTEWQSDQAELPDEHMKAISNTKATGYFMVAYAGAHGLANALDYFLDAAYQMQEYPVRFVLIGQGPEKDRLIRKTQARRQENIIFLPPVDKRIMPVILDQMDALYIGLKGNSLFRFGVSPNKLMDYLMAGKPIINAIMSGNDIVTESGSGISIPPENPGEIVHAVLYLMYLPIEKRMEMGQKGKAYVMMHHDYKVLAQQFIASIEQSHV